MAGAIAAGDDDHAHLLQVASTFIDVHIDNGIADPTRIRRSLEETLIGGYWGFHVRAQNAAILVHRESTEDTLLMAWQVQAKNKDVTGNVGIYQSIPQMAVRFPWSRLLDNVEHLSDLAAREQWNALPKTLKSDELFHETRDVNNPFYILDVFIATLGGDVLDSSGVTTLSKKMNDEVRYESSERPWRREPIWAALKSILHMTSMMQGGKETPYKTLVQLFLAFSLEKTCACPDMGICSSSLVEASRKLVHRLEKLKANDNLTNEALMGDIIVRTETATKKAMEPVKVEWERICNREDAAVANFPLSDVARDIVHNLPRSKATLERLNLIATRHYGNISVGADAAEEKEIGPPTIFVRGREWSPFDRKDIDLQTERLESAFENHFKTSPQDYVGTLNDVSQGIMDAFGNIDGAALQPNADAVALALLKLEKRLIETGLGLPTNEEEQRPQPFAEDVRSKSQIILIALTICLLIDKLACAEYPLLAEHKLGVPVDILGNLFLDSFQYRQHLDSIESYLKLRKKASYLQSCLESKCSPESFSVRFAMQSSSMQDTRDRILNKCRSLQNDKRLEKERKQRQYDELMRGIARSSCSCQNTPYWCQRCKDQQEAKQIKLQFHEKLLPESDHEQLAVVYELKMPEILACQRDCLVLFANMICNETWQRHSDWVGLWRNELQLFCWCDKRETQVVQLGSTRKKVMTSHYGNRSKHVGTHQDFILKNGYETIAMGSNGSLVDITSWKWDMSAHTYMKVQEGPYSSLEYYFNSFSHDENAVIAQKSEASELLSLAEFEEVGCLRAGEYLQLQRMLTGLRQRIYSLDRPEIVSLFSCVLWQVGPRGDSVL